MIIHAKEPIAMEIKNGANVEEVLAKYFGLSLMKSEVKNVKEAIKTENERAIYSAIETIVNRHKSHIGRTII